MRDEQLAVLYNAIGSVWNLIAIGLMAICTLLALILWRVW